VAFLSISFSNACVGDTASAVCSMHCGKACRNSYPTIGFRGVKKTYKGAGILDAIEIDFGRLAASYGRFCFRRPSVNYEGSKPSIVAPAELLREGFNCDNLVKRDLLQITAE
jgi:hypothetical protein